MGKPSKGHALLLVLEYIEHTKTTRGTETSKYPEEKKSTEIAEVAASERAGSPNPVVVRSFRALSTGGCGCVFARA